MYRVLSPDGFDCEFDGIYHNLTQANFALERFVKAFVSQGYYSTSSRKHIALIDLPDYCQIVEL